MTTIRLRLATIGLIVALAAGLGSVAASAASPSITVSGFSDEQEAQIEWALGLFDQADLSLPGIDFVRHDATDRCFGRAGAHVHENGRSTIHICTADAKPAREFLYLHEIAHAWDRVGLTDERRDAFLELRGLTHWRAGEEWHERGAEHAAEIVVWGLMDRPIKSIRIPDTGCAELRAGYIALTGQPPLHGSTDHCT